MRRSLTRPGRSRHRLLDVGCGGGFALLLAARRGATVAGLDATLRCWTSPPSGCRAPNSPLATWRTSCIRAAGPFDVVTAFNAVQIAAGDQVAALRQMARVAQAQQAGQRSGLGTARAVRERGDVRRASGR